MLKDRKSYETGNEIFYERKHLSICYWNGGGSVIARLKVNPKLRDIL